MPYLNHIFVIYSSFVKKLSKTRIPKSLRKPFFKVFGMTFMGMGTRDLEEASTPLEQYEDLSQFFSRSIDLNLRPINSDDIISPCDGMIRDYGNIHDLEQTLRVKGKDQSLSALVGSDDLLKRYKNGSYLIIYLSPRNYHRFHAPMNGKIDHYEHIDGACYPVNRLGIMLTGNVYAKNERVVLNINNEHLQMCMIIVGACAVRGIKMLKHKNDIILKAEELGHFELGSSIVLLLNKKVFPDYEPVYNTVRARGALFSNSLIFEQLL